MVLEILLFPEGTRFLCGPTAVSPPTSHPPPSVSYNAPPPLWQQAFAGEVSAVCALNRPYQEQTIVEGVTLTEYTEWKITILYQSLRSFKDIGIMFVVTQVIMVYNDL